MAAPKGNIYWRIRGKDGKDKKYKSASDLYNACNEYFDFVDNNPLIETVVQKRKISRDEEVIELVQVPKMRAYTIEGLCNFLDICVKTWYNYKEYGKDYLQVATRVDSVIRNQKFEGAASGFLNPNIIARDLGLRDNHDHSSSDGSMSPKPTILNMTDKDVDLEHLTDE